MVEGSPTTGEEAVELAALRRELDELKEIIQGNSHLHTISRK